MNFAKRIICTIITFSVVICALSASPVEAAYNVPFDVYSDVAYLLNTDTGTVIYEKNPDKKTYPASLTKIMTAIIAIENVPDLENTLVTAPAYIYNEFAGINVSTADIRKSETLSMLDLLYALILPSSCEAASIIADYVGDGSIESFVAMMNQKASDLGAVNTHFANAHGLFDESQVTTARDMAIITQEALSHPIFKTICNTPIYNMPSTPEHPSNWVILHTNWIMQKGRGDGYYSEYVHGVKTGAIPEVGRNLVSTASKDGYNYLLVTMGAPNYDSEGNPWPTGVNRAFDDALAFYDWAFNNFSVQKIVKQNEIMDEVAVTLGMEQDFVTLVSSNEVTALLPNEVTISSVQKTRYLPESVEAPIAKGTRLGSIELRLAGEVIGTVQLVASQDIVRNETLYWLDLTLMFFKQPIVIALLVLLGLLIPTYAAVLFNYRRAQRRRNARRKLRGL